MDALNSFLGTANSILWNNTVLYILVATGVVFTVWSGFCQFRSLTHGLVVIRGRYDNPGDPGAINHYQALSAALSATVGLGNIGGVSLAITLGGPGAVFWMWVIGFLGMAIKLTEVSLSMLYRNTDDPNNPHGGPMWVVSKGLALRSAELGKVGKAIGMIFCVTCLISTFTGGNMFQAWNTAEITETYFGIPSILSGIILAILVAAVILGGIKRIGAVAGRLVPIMCSMYLIAGLYVLLLNYSAIPEIFTLIVKSAFVPAEASGAFLGGTAGYAFLFGMKRALFSNEAGQGSSPMAHSAAKSREPIREAIVAGLEPFIDTIVVCSVTALVIISTGIWDRGAESALPRAPQLIQVSENTWTLESMQAPERFGDTWVSGETVFLIAHGDFNPATNADLHRLNGTVTKTTDGRVFIDWDVLQSTKYPVINDVGIYVEYLGATMTAKAFDSVVPNLGKWLVTITVWLFALSTIISWNYYGEQAMVFMFGQNSVTAYRLVYCAMTIVATSGFIKTDIELDNLTGFGTGVMLFANVPIIWLFGRQAMMAYKDYIKRLDAGRMGPGHEPPSLDDLISGQDVK